jgi:hypothetical protein
VGSVAIIGWNRIAASFRKMPACKMPAYTRGMQMNRRIGRQRRSEHSPLRCIDCPVQQRESIDAFI